MICAHEPVSPRSSPPARAPPQVETMITNADVRDEAYMQVRCALASRGAVIRCVIVRACARVRAWRGFLLAFLCVCGQQGGLGVCLRYCARVEGVCACVRMWKCVNVEMCECVNV